MLFVGTSIIHPSTEGVFLLCNILDLLIYSIEEIVRKRDELLDESSEIYCAAPLTDGKSYAAAQAALKTNEEQFFTQEELNRMLPAHLRKK